MTTKYYDLPSDKQAGVYVATSPELQEKNIVKFGFSMNMNKRIYEHVGTIYRNAFYAFVVSFINKSKEFIFYIEQRVLEETKNYYPKGYTQECRKITNDELKKIIIEILKEGNLKEGNDYVIIENFKPHRQPCKNLNCKKDNCENIQCDSPIYKVPKNYLREFKEQKEEIIEETITFKEYQQAAIDKWENNTGVLCHATGLGKGLTGCVGFPAKFIKENPTKKVLYHVVFKDILDTTMKNMKKYKEGGIVPDYLKYQEYSSDKKNEIGKDINYVLTNTAQIDNVLKMYKPDLIITDECHNISAENIYKTLKKQKEQGVIQLGLSATPVKQNKDSKARFNDLFDGNMIDNIGIIKAIRSKYLTPFKLAWLYIKDVEIHYRKITDEARQNIIRETLPQVINTINKSSTKKIVCWTNDKRSSKAWSKALNESGINKKIYVSNSEVDPKSIEINNFINTDEGVMICVNRFRQGTDDPTIDLGLRLDPVLDSETHVMLQELGRVIRKYENKDLATYCSMCELKDQETKKNELKQKLLEYTFMLDDIEDLDIEFIREGKNIIVQEKKEPKTRIMTIELENEEKEFIQETFEDLYREYMIQKNKHMKEGEFIELMKQSNIKTSYEYSKYLMKINNSGLPEYPELVYEEFSWDKMDSKVSLEELVEIIKNLEIEEIETMELYEIMDYIMYNDKIPKNICAYYNIEETDLKNMILA